MQFPDLPLKSVRHYALYMTEDNDDLDDFPPLDNREPCSKFGFSHLTLAERRPLVPVTPVDYQNNLPTKSITSEDDRVRLAVRSLTSIELNGGGAYDDSVSNGASNADEQQDDYEERMLSHDDMLEAPLYRTYRLQIIDKRFFKTDVTLGVSAERIEIDQHKNAKFWTKQKAVTYPIEAIAYCEISERRQQKAVLRIWLRSSSSVIMSALSSSEAKPLTASSGVGKMPGASSPTSPGHSSYAFFMSSSGSGAAVAGSQHAHIRFKHYDFEADVLTAEHINKKLNCILEVRSSDVRREYLQMRERKLEKSQGKKHLKL